MNMTLGRWDKTFTAVSAPGSENVADLWDYYNRLWAYYRGETSDKDTAVNWKEILRWLLFIVVILLTGGVGFWCYNHWDRKQTKEDTE